MSSPRSIATGLCLILLIASACTVTRNTTPSPAATSKPRGTPMPVASAVVVLSPLPTIATLPLPANASPTALPSAATEQDASTVFCADAKPQTLIASFKSAVTASDGPLLASLVSPTHGMDARLFRDGRVVNYDQEHARFVLDSTFVVDWGLAPGSGLETKGSFHDLLVPALQDVFGRDYQVSCDQLQVGGTTYHAAWPYAGINFYSAYYPGTQANGNLDWRTWVLGMHFVGGKPYLYAIMQFRWEP